MFKASRSATTARRIPRVICCKKAWTTSRGVQSDKIGGALAAKEYGEEVLLVGKPEVVANLLKEKGLSDVKGITIMPANDLVDMHDDPASVLRRKPDSSMAVAFKLLKAGEGDALVSAGNTGALLKTRRGRAMTHPSSCRTRTVRVMLACATNAPPKCCSSSRSSLRCMRRR